MCHFLKTLKVGLGCCASISFLANLFVFCLLLITDVIAAPPATTVVNDQYKFTQLTLNPFVTDPASGFDYTGYQLHRIYVHTVNETDYVKRIFGNEAHPAEFHAPGGIYNNNFCIGSTSGGVPPPGFGAGFGTNAFEYDSWVGIGLTHWPDQTIGEEDVVIDTTGLNPWANQFALEFMSSGNYGPVDIAMDDTATEGGWYLNSDDAMNGYAGDDHKAIVMQLMMNSTFTWTLNAEIWIDGDSANTVIVSQTYNGTSLESPVIEGCTSPNACNFNALATTDNGSCEFPETYYDCDDVCVNDTDGDGVCNELEIEGCTSVLACNYDVAATEDDASCIFAEGCDVCTGETDGTGTINDNDADDDGVCDADEVVGCQDLIACNFDENATDAGSCIYQDSFGVCDGDGTIQGAIDNAQAGDSIIIPQGVYSESLVIDHSLILVATEEVLIDVSGSVTGITITAGVSDVVIEGLEITGNNLTGSGITINPGCSNVVIRNNVISDIQLPGGGNQSPLSYGILCWGDSEPLAPPSGILIEDNSIEGVLGSAISLGSNSESVVIRANSFDNIIPVEFQGSYLSIGVQAELANNLEISGNSYSNLLQSNSLVNCTNASIQGNSYHNSSLMMLTTFPHSVEFFDAPWWSSTLSLDGVNLYEVYVNTPEDETYLFAVSLEVFTQTSSYPGCDNPDACNYDDQALSDDGSCILPVGCEVCSGESDGTGTLVDNDADDDGICDDVDDCVGYFDALGVCNGPCAADEDDDGICDDVDDCVGYFDALGVCNGPCAADEDDDGICDDVDDCVGYFDALEVCNGSCTADADDDDICDDVDDCVGSFDAIGVCNGDCSEDLDSDGICDDVDDCIGSFDVLGVCNGSCTADADGDGICDDVDDCIGAFDALGVCNGSCAADADNDDICDDVDECIGSYDVLGVCNGDCTSDADSDGICDDVDDCVGSFDALDVCNGSCITDDDDDGICDDVDDCVGYFDALGVCNGSCVADEDSDGICDDVDDCVGAYDALGVCNGSCTADADDDDICDDIDDCVGSFDAIGVCNGDCSEDSDSDGICDDVDDCVGAYDALGVCNGSCSSDLDSDGICDDVDDCVGAYDALGVCNGACVADVDEDMICDDVDDCVGAYDAVGVCNGTCVADADNDGVCDDVDDCVGVYDALGVCNGDCEADIDSDGICDDVDVCVGAFDALQVCNGDCAADADGDGICDDVDDCVGAYDALGVCNGPCEADVDADGVCDVDEIVGCQNEAACNYDSAATDPGDCFIAAPYYDCLGECVNDANGDGVCDEIEVLLAEEFLDGIAHGLEQCTGGPEYCGEGTIWSEDFQMCIEDSSCPGDLDGDGIVGTNDLLLILMDYGFDCE